jgi:hypothetical protein
MRCVSIAGAGSHLRALEGRPLMRLVLGLLSVVALAFAVPAAADPPTAFPFEDVFPDVNPCTGDIMTVTIAGTSFVHFHGSRIVGHSERTITTSDGAVGHGTDSFVANGQIFMFRMTDIMTDASGGYRFRARGVFVGDAATETVRVDKFELTCLGP